VITAHVAGMPVEEAVLQLAPAGIALLAALRVMIGRMQRTRR
jgi:hypothetical protein